MKQHAPQTASSQRMEQICDAAAKLFYTNGYHATTIEELANEVGMLKGSLYYYIKSKEDLLFQLLLDVIVSGQTRVAKKLEGVNDPLERLTVGLEGHIEYIIDSQVRVGLFLHEFDVVQGARRKRIKEEMTRYQKIFVDIINQGKQQGLVADLDSWLVVDGMLGMCNWICRWYPGRKNPSSVLVKQTYKALILNGMLTTS